MHRESERLQKMITSNRQSHSACSGPNLVKVAGLEICAEMSFPNASLVETAPYFPITGPMNAGITLYKRDIKMTGYKLEARSTHVSIFRIYIYKYIQRFDSLTVMVKSNYWLNIAHIYT